MSQESYYRRLNVQAERAREKIRNQDQMRRHLEHHGIGPGSEVSTTYGTVILGRYLNQQHMFACSGLQGMSKIGPVRLWAELERSGALSPCDATCEQFKVKPSS